MHYHGQTTEQIYGSVANLVNQRFHLQLGNNENSSTIWNLLIHPTIMLVCFEILRKPYQFRTASTLLDISLLNWLMKPLEELIDGSHLVIGCNHIILHNISGGSRCIRLSIFPSGVLAISLHIITEPCCNQTLFYKYAILWFWMC